MEHSMVSTYLEKWGHPLVESSFNKLYVDMCDTIRELIEENEKLKKDGEEV